MQIKKNTQLQEKCTFWKNEVLNKATEILCNLTKNIQKEG